MKKKKSCYKLAEMPRKLVKIIFRFPTPLLKKKKLGLKKSVENFKINVLPKCPKWRENESNMIFGHPTPLEKNILKWSTIKKSSYCQKWPNKAYRMGT